MSSDFQEVPSLLQRNLVAAHWQRGMSSGTRLLLTAIDDNSLTFQCEVFDCFLHFPAIVPDFSSIFFRGLLEMTPFGQQRKR